MENRLREYIDELFASAPNSKKTTELKEEMLQNLHEKYSDLRAEGKEEQAAYNLAVASVGDVEELITYLKQQSPMQQYAYSEAMEEKRRRSALFVAGAVMLYVICPVPLFLIQNEIGLVLMLVFAGLATFLLIYQSMTQPKYQKVEDTLVEDFKEWKMQSTQQKRARKSITSAVWSIGLAVYFILSFLTMAWHITWIIFLIIEAVDAIIKAIFDLRKDGPL